MNTRTLLPGTGRSRFLLRLALLLGLASPAFAALLVTDLRCDWAVDPTGVDSAPPRLSWKLESVQRGDYQTAWQVQVASSRERLLAGKSDVWDSRHVKGGA